MAWMPSSDCIAMRQCWCQENGMIQASVKACAKAEPEAERRICPNMSIPEQNWPSSRCKIGQFGPGLTCENSNGSRKDGILFYPRVDVIKHLHCHPASHTQHDPLDKLCPTGLRGQVISFQRTMLGSGFSGAGGRSPNIQEPRSSHLGQILLYYSTH